MFDELWSRVIELDEELSSSYEYHQQDVLHLADDVEDALVEEFGHIPPWEKKELETAKKFVDSNWLKAALNAISTALVVSEYSDEEYWGGFTYTNPRAAISKRRIV